MCQIHNGVLVISVISQRPTWSYREVCCGDGELAVIKSSMVLVCHGLSWYACAYIVYTINVLQLNFYIVYTIYTINLRTNCITAQYLLCFNVPTIKHCVYLKPAYCIAGFTPLCKLCWQMAPLPLPPLLPVCVCCVFVLRCPLSPVHIIGACLSQLRAWANNPSCIETSLW